MRGWDADGVLLLFAVLTTTVGIVLGLLSNARRIGRMAADGELDAHLALPVPTLAHVLVRRVDASALGDAVFGVGLFLLAGAPTPTRTLVFALGVAAGVVLLTGFLVATGSLAFFAGRGESGELGEHAIILLSSYPADIFAGSARTLVYTAVPAAFVATVPARLIADFDVGDALVLVAVAALFAGVGWALFALGLRRYTSGAVWTRA